MENCGLGILGPTELQEEKRMNLKHRWENLGVKNADTFS